jgi:hypothetical protein
MGGARALPNAGVSGRSAEAGNDGAPNAGVVGVRRVGVKGGTRVAVGAAATGGGGTTVGAGAAATVREVVAVESDPPRSASPRPAEAASLGEETGEEIR